MARLAEMEEKKRQREKEIEEREAQKREELRREADSKRWAYLLFTHVDHTFEN